MAAGAGRGHRSKWRKFKRKFGALIFISLAILLIVAFVGFIMYILTSPDFRIKWKSGSF